MHRRAGTYRSGAGTCQDADGQSSRRLQRYRSAHERADAASYAAVLLQYGDTVPLMSKECSGNKAPEAAAYDEDVHVGCFMFVVECLMLDDIGFEYVGAGVD